MKRRLYKRSRQKFHEIQESFRENIRLRSSEDSKNNNAEKASGASNQHSPESVLYESDSCLCIEKLSPEIILNRSKIRSQTEIGKDAIEDAIEGSNSSEEYHDSNLLMCDFNIESRDDFINLEKYYPKGDTRHCVDDPLDLTDSIYLCSLPSLNNVLNSDANETINVMHGGQSLAVLEETTRQGISQSAKFPSNLESQSSNDSVLGSANFYDKHDKRSLEKNSNQRENCENIPGTRENCYSLDKTFSMNDNLIREMNNYLEGQSSTIADQSNMEMTRKLQEESARFAIFQEIEKRSGFTDDVGRLSSDELAGLSVDASIEDDDHSSRNDKKGRNGIPNDNNRFDLILEKIGERLTANWSEFRKRFTYLQRVGRQICAENSERACLLYKIFPYTSVSTFSSSCTPLSSPDNVGHKFTKDGEKTEKIQDSKFKTRSEANSWGESPTKCFRNAKLMFDYEGEVKKQKQSEIRTEITDSLFNKSEEHSLLDSLSCDKKYWDNTPKSTFHLATANYDDRNNYLQKSYKKLREVIIPSSSTKSPRTEKFNDLIATLRFENEKTLQLLSKKVTQLSIDFDQVRTSTEATLKALTTEINIVREASRKMTEDNVTLMQELKKLRETLEEIRSKFLQPVLFSSCSSSFSPSRLPPPPPPPLPPPPPPSSLILPQSPSSSKVHTSESAPSIPPPPPPLPLTSLQSSKPRIIQSPTTPNSSKSNKRRTPRKCSTPLFNRPTITVEDLLKVTLKKAPQNIKDSRRNTVPGPRGPVVSLEMLRNVKLKSAKRKPSDQTGKSPRSGRIVKNRIASNINLSPILTGSEGNLERILRQVNLARPRRLISNSNSFRDRDFAKEMQSQSLIQSQSALE
ncbi:hypothetical protein EAG_10366 [Camponotus floridanus]|uniref:Uncharacterized protein n=1 Tax=Camponotus floridanus TaxID=104421 RepID=E2ADN1_CAMFO|nr:hypothetical protein EAG_10366 [Camponotus floridanus]